MFFQNTTTVTVSVTDVNDHTPRCSQSLFAFTAAEANILRVDLGDVRATDGDGSSVGSGQLSYRLGSTNLRNNITVTSSVRAPNLASLSYLLSFRVLSMVSQDWTMKSLMIRGPSSLM